MKTASQKTMRYIVRNENILGGAPTIVGTRIPAEKLIPLIEEGYEEKNIKKEFPELSVEKIRGALSELISAGMHSL